MHGSDERVSARKHFTTGFLVVCLASLISSLSHGTGFFHLLEMGNLDVFLRAERAPESSALAVVEITDSDYLDRFGGTSPLKFEGVSNLIRAVALSGPALVVVDLDTSGWSVQQRIAVYSAAQSPQTGPVQIVWALGGWEDAQGAHLVTDPDPRADECFGAPAVSPDEDGVVRSYYPFINFDARQVSNLAVVAADLYSHHGGNCKWSDAPGKEAAQSRLIDFRGGRDAFIHLTAGGVVAMADARAWRAQNPLKHKIVVIGGSYRAARDKYMTSTGYLDGEDILAHAIESQASGRGIQSVGRLQFVAFDLLVGMFLVTATYFLERHWSLVISFIAVPALSLGMSYILFNSLGYFASFLPLVAGVFIHELIEHGMEDRRLRQECARLRKEVGILSVRSEHVPK